MTEIKCIVKDCANHKHQGKFIGDLCSPCFSFLVEGEGTFSQLYRNTVLAERDACAAAKAIRARGNT
jgi:hypothetical protein